MADYNLRLLTTLQDTDYIQVNNSDGIQFGLFKSSNFNTLNIGSGTITNNGTLTVKSGGGNILSLRNSSNVEQAFVSNTGEIGANVLYCQSLGGSNGGQPLILFNYSGLLRLGGSTSSYPAIKRNGAAIDFKLADDTGYANITGGIIYAGDTNNYITNAGQWLCNVNFNMNGNLNNTNSGFVSILKSVIGGGSGNSSSVLTLNSTTTGFLPPRMTTAQINAIVSPAEGLEVYNTDLHIPCFFNGTAWQRVTYSAM